MDWPGAIAALDGSTRETTSKRQEGARTARRSADDAQRTRSGRERGTREGGGVAEWAEALFDLLRGEITSVCNAFPLCIAYLCNRVS